MTERTSQLLTVAEVAEWLRVEPRYVYRLASSGELLRVYIGRYVRIPAISVEAYIDAHTVEAVKPVRPRRPGPRGRRHLKVVHDAEQQRPTSALRFRPPSSLRPLPGPLPRPGRLVRPADDTFATKAEAEVWLTRKEAELIEGEWIDPDAGAILVPDYAATWIEERAGLRPKTVLIYRGLLRCHITPNLATVTVGSLTLPRVRRWRKKLLDSGVSPVTTAKAYRLLRAVMNTAVDDGLIKRNPCRIKGAGNEESPERPVLAVAQVYALADAIGPAYRALILRATFASLRWAELTALRPEDIDLEACTVRVTRQLHYHQAGYSFGPPKLRAGRRVVTFPNLITRDLRKHLEALPKDARLVFISSTGTPLRHSNLRRRVWLPALETAGLSGVHFHDLRHTGNQLIANAGANPRELLARMGHDNPRAALIYLHSSADRQRALANAVGDTARAQLSKPKRRTNANRSGT